MGLDWQSLLGGALAIAAFVSIVGISDASSPGESGEALRFVSQMDTLAESARSSDNTSTLEFAAAVSRQIAIERSDLLGQIVSPSPRLARWVGSYTRSARGVARSVSP